MMYTVMYTSLLITMFAMTLAHPVSLLVAIIMQTVTVAIMACMYQKSFWFSYILFLIFLGGMLVLFSYITSLASNYMFKPTTNSLLLPLLAAPALLAILPSHQFSMTPPAPLTALLTNKFFFQSFSVTLTLMTYLLITLFVVINITSLYSGPLRYQQ